MAEPAPIDKLTTAQVAARLGVTQSRVHALMRAGRLPSVRVGPLHLIDPADVDKVKVRKPGRPWPTKAKAMAAKTRKRK